jgi:hypothetical protein
MTTSIDRILVTRGDARLEVLTEGKGPPIVLLPSLGRGLVCSDESPR